MLLKDKLYVMPKIEKELVVKSPQGLHARPAAMFVQIASKFNSSITLKKGSERVNGKSIMGILTLGANKNSKIVLEINGDDADQVLKELEEFLGKEEPL